MVWPRNRFVFAKTEQELFAKVYALQKKGWLCVDYTDFEPFCAYLERPSLVRQRIRKINIPTCGFMLKEVAQDA